MPLQIACPTCTKMLAYGEQFAGRAVRCPHCQGAVPTPPAAAPMPPPAVPMTPPAAEPPRVEEIPVLDMASGPARVWQRIEYYTQTDETIVPQPYVAGLKQVFLGALILYFTVLGTGFFQWLTGHGGGSSLFQAWYHHSVHDPEFTVLAKYQRYAANVVVLLGALSVISGMLACARTGDAKRKILPSLAAGCFGAGAGLAILAPLLTDYLPYELGHSFVCRLFYILAYLLIWAAVGLLASHAWPLVQQFGNYQQTRRYFLALTAAIFGLHFFDYLLSWVLQPANNVSFRDPQVARYFAVSFIVYLVWCALLTCLMVVVMLPLRKIDTGD